MLKTYPLVIIKYIYEGKNQLGMFKSVFSKPSHWQGKKEDRVFKHQHAILGKIYLCCTCTISKTIHDSTVSLSLPNIKEWGSFANPLFSPQNTPTLCITAFLPSKLSQLLSITKIYDSDPLFTPRVKQINLYLCTLTADLSWCHLSSCFPTSRCVHEQF